MARKSLIRAQKMSNLTRRNWIKSASLAATAACVSKTSRADYTPKLASTSSHGFQNLSINENQFGPSPKALEAIDKTAGFANEYPLESQERLRQLIAKSEGVAPNQVILGAGSSDITMGVSAALGEPGKNFVSSDPSFHPLMLWAEKFGVEHIKIPWSASHSVDLERIEKSVTPATNLVYICNPENPAGTLAAPSDLYAFCQRVSQKAPILIDEAYLEYAGDVSKLSMTCCVREGLPVIILKTFSKAYGLGGMRVGYAITTPELARKIEQYYVTGIGCGCSHTSLEAAIAAYKDQAWLASVREKTTQARKQLIAYYESIGQPYIPSVTTFILAPISKDSKQVSDAIFGAFNLKISPRLYFDQNYLRISMGTPQQMDTLIKALSYVI